MYIYNIQQVAENASALAKPIKQKMSPKSLLRPLFAFVPTPKPQPQSSEQQVAQTQDNRTTMSVLSVELAEEIAKAQAVFQSVWPSPEHLRENRRDLLTSQKDLPAPEYEFAHVQTMAVYIYVFSKVLYIVILYGEYTRAMTFENFICITWIRTIFKFGCT